MKENTNNPLKNANAWTYIGTIGYFASSFLFAAEWLGQYAELTAQTLGFSLKSSYRFFGHKEIGGIQATYYAIGFSIALVATLGFCYAVFFQFLHYQDESSRQKKYKCLSIKYQNIKSLMNLIALCGSVIITVLWVAGASLSVFLLPVKFSLLSKNIITYGLIFLGVLACISYVRMYYQTLPGHIKNNQTLKVDHQTLAKYAFMISWMLYNNNHLPDSTENHKSPKIKNETLASYIFMIIYTMTSQTLLDHEEKQVEKIDQKSLEKGGKSVLKILHNQQDSNNSTDTTNLSQILIKIKSLLQKHHKPSKKIDKKTLKKNNFNISNIMENLENNKNNIPESAKMGDFEKLKQFILEKYIIEYTSMIIFSFVGFFSNSYFAAYILQLCIISNFHTLLWCGMSLYAWVVGTIIGLFFTISAVYCFSRMYSKKPPTEINNVIFDNDELAQFNELAELNNITLLKQSPQDIALSKKIWLKLALVGLLGVTILDLFYPITISLRYIFNNHENNFAFLFICIVALFLSRLCAEGPYETTKASVEEYNHTKISLKLPLPTLCHKVARVITFCH